MKDTCIETTDNTLNVIATSGLLHINFYNYGRYKDMKPDSTQPARLYETAKTNKFENSEEITETNLKFQPTTYQTGTFTYNRAKVISDYLKPLCKN